MKYMLRKILSLFIGLLALASVSDAQPPAYAMQAVSGTYTPLSGGTAVVLTYNGSANYDDGIATPANAVPIGFTFNYNGTNYTSIRPCANGFASFSTTALANNTDTWTNNLTSGPAANQRPILAPLWDDHDMVANGSVTYQLSGTAPNRVLTIEWANVRWEYNALSGVISFQIKLYETTNVIEFVYRPESGAIANTGDLGASIGITTTGTGANSFLSLSDAGTNPQVSSTVETTTIATKPASGQIYRWIPYCSASATNTTGEKITNFTYNTINSNNASTAGYVNLTSTSTTTYLNPTSSLPFSATVSNFISTDQVIVFIDYNHNGVFTDPGETIYTSALPMTSGTINGTINIPALSSNVLQGPTRLRIRLHDTNNGANNTSCGTSTTGQVLDYTVNIQPCAAAVITAQPANTTICNGGNGSISATVSGTNITYQWQVSTNNGVSYSDLSNNATYAGVTTNNLTITGATLSMSGYRFRLVLNGTCTPANTTSNAAILTINTPASITTQPAVNVAVCKNSNASFTVAAAGTSPTYQWQISTDGGINYSNISGATAATLTLNSVTMAQNGNRYRCVATVISCGSVISAASILTVYELPTVTASVAPVDSIKPTMHTYVTAGSVPPGVTFAWMRNNVPLPGATGASIIADVNGLGIYKVTVTDIHGCTNTSNEVEVKSLPSYKLWIYPNPNRGQFQMRLYSDNVYSYDEHTVTIYNSSGAFVLRKEFPITNQYLQMDFDLRGHAAGVYVVRVTHRFTGRTVTGQFVIQ